MIPLLILGLVFLSFAASHFAEAKSLNDIWFPCSFRDSNCIVGLWQRSVEHLAAGSEELRVPPLDPLKVDNIDVDVPGLVFLRFNGFMRGLKGCNFDSAHTTIKKGHFRLALDLHCNVSLKGHYNVTANTTALLGPGNDALLKADGIGKVKLDNLSFKFLIDLDIKRDENGIIKFIMKDGPIGYKYNIGGPVKFGASKIYVGNEDITIFVVSFLNQNWRFVMDVFGDFFFKKAMKIISEFPRAVINSIPASSFFLEDMHEYLLN